MAGYVDHSGFSRVRTGVDDLGVGMKPSFFCRVCVWPVCACCNQGVHGHAGHILEYRSDAIYIHIKRSTDSACNPDACRSKRPRTMRGWSHDMLQCSPVHLDFVSFTQITPDNQLTLPWGHVEQYRAHSGHVIRGDSLGQLTTPRSSLVHQPTIQNLGNCSISPIPESSNCLRAAYAHGSAAWDQTYIQTWNT
ncbi:hypothetical protein BO99DRAFT_128874 [Aspergillus violaceofuscus CBS 115571]|uniref:Uncharacterized protein n=1 Tax=Aspergillus violaceofuscus (strain CBS 115571) TaxID=1450538 RepID=A0A2V5I6Q3_ASPV1|nr:hypothetical protein BO99DRAFT_128874 [Aspergillus violaceofuscus CBS 115571]